MLPVDIASSRDMECMVSTQGEVLLALLCGVSPGSPALTRSAPALLMVHHILILIQGFAPRLDPGTV